MDSLPWLEPNHVLPPPGFRNPTLGRLLREDASFSTSSWILPKTSSSRLQFHDLHWNKLQRCLQKQAGNVSRTFTLDAVRDIPPLTPGVRTVSRHMYVALWNGKKVLSNIHVIRALPSKSHENWNFSSKSGNEAVSQHDGNILVRGNSDDPNLGILFEFCYTYKGRGTRRDEISCGWCVLPLFDTSTSVCLPGSDTTFELNIHGGTPLEENVFLSRATTTRSSFRKLLLGTPQPKFIVKSTSVDRATRDIHDTLPETIITCQHHATLIALYRHHAATIYCHTDEIPPHNISDPILAYFPRAILQPDLMDVLRRKYVENLKKLPRKGQKELDHQHQVFVRTFKESVFGLMQCGGFPLSEWADPFTDMRRESFARIFLEGGDPVGHLLSATYQHKPFDIKKLMFRVLASDGVDDELPDVEALA